MRLCCGLPLSGLNRRRRDNYAFYVEIAEGPASLSRTTSFLTIRPDRRRFLAGIASPNQQPSGCAGTRLISYTRCTSFRIASFCVTFRVNNERIMTKIANRAPQMWLLWINGCKKSCSFWDLLLSSVNNPRREVITRAQEPEKSDGPGAHNAPHEPGWGRVGVIFHKCRVSKCCTQRGSQHLLPPPPSADIDNWKCRNMQQHLLCLHRWTSLYQTPACPEVCVWTSSRLRQNSPAVQSARAL